MGKCFYVLLHRFQFQPLVALESERTNRFRKSLLPVHSLSLGKTLVYLHVVYSCIIYGYKTVTWHIAAQAKLPGIVEQISDPNIFCAGSNTSHDNHQPNPLYIYRDNDGSRSRFLRFGRQLI